jgi:hypothetical protein
MASLVFVVESCIKQRIKVPPVPVVFELLKVPADHQGPVRSFYVRWSWRATTQKRVPG